MKAKTFTLKVSFRGAGNPGPGKSIGIGFYCNFTDKFGVADLHRDLVESQVHGTLKLSNDGQTDDMFVEPFAAEGFTFHSASVKRLGFSGKLTLKGDDEAKDAKRLQDFAGRDGVLVFKRIGDAGVIDGSDDESEDEDDPDQQTLADA